MAQTLKDHVRARIDAAALEVFAASGYERGSMAAIAKRAGVATANLYRYYANKEELFSAVVTDGLASDFERRLDQRVRSLGTLADPTVDVEPPTAPAAELLEFWIEHRLAVVVILDRAAGTPYAAYGERFVERLVSLTEEQLRAMHPGLQIAPNMRHLLHVLFDNTRRAVAAILETNADDDRIREAIAAFWSYQIPGLRGLVSWIVERSATSRPDRIT